MTRVEMKLAVAIVVSLALLGGSPAAGQGGMQAQKAAAMGFVERVSAGDADATFAFMQENFSASMLERRSEDDWRSFAKQLERHAGLEVVGIDINDGETSIATQNPSGMTVHFSFEFKPEEPGKIAGLGMRAGGGHGRESSLPPFEPPAGANVEQLREALGAYFDRIGSEDAFSGTVLVAKDGEPIYTGAWGLASREWNAPNTVDMRYGLGSINKTFTKIAIAQLALAGKLELDDTIADHLPDYPNAEVARKVTIQHIVDHTSGLGDIFNERFFNSSKLLYREPSDFFPVFADQPLQFEPGEGRSYSNAGYMVLGAIIAAATDGTYSEYVEKHIFEPVGMTETGFFARDEIHPRIAVGYTRMGFDGPGDELRNNLLMMAVRGSSAGNAYSTVGDMLKFDEAVREHKLIPPAWTRWFFGGDEPGPEDLESVPAERAMVGIGYAGGAPGVSAVVESDGVLTVIALANQDEPGAEDVTRAIFRPLSKALVKAD